MTTGNSNAGSTGREDLFRYLDAGKSLESTQAQLEALEESEAVETFHSQMALLQRRLLSDPQAFRDMFIADGTNAIVWEFKQPELGADFIKTFWNLLLRDDDTSKVLMRFVWNVPLGLKRKFVRAIDQHLSDRYPMFKGLSEGWPAESFIPPYIRSPEERSTDFELVNQGYLGYMNVGLTAREVDLLVWLEVLRDKQCEEKPCEVGLHVPGKFEPKGGCPVKIHIPQVLDLFGNGRFREAMELIESCNPLPNVTGRVCPQELQCQGVCAHTKQPIEIGQLEWFLPQREKVVNPDGVVERFAGVPDPWARAVKPPIAIVGSGPAGLINAYLLAAEGFPVTVFEAFHALGGVLRYGIPEFRLPNELIDDVVGKIKLLGGKFVSNFVVGKTATLQDLRAAGFWKVFVGTGAGLPRFMNVPGEHLINVMSANEFLTRVNLMQGLRADYETPLPETKDKEVIIIGGGNTAMDAARTARRLGGNVTIVYRRTQSEMPARVEELHHALEEGIKLKVLRSDYQNQKYRLEDKLLKHYPEEIQKAKNRIAALKNDAQIADAHPQDKENFCGMTIKGMVFDEKKAAGERLMLACKEMPNADMMLLGTYRGFELNIRFDSFKNEHQIVLRGELSYPVPLGDDPRGNIVRLDNAIGNFADRIADADAALDSLEQQKQAAEVEIAKPFAQEEELQTKSARLAELDALLNMEHQSSRTEPEAEEKPDARPSVLAALEEKADKVEPVRPFKSYLDKDGDAR